MKTHRYLIIAGIVTMAALATLALFTQLTQAQGPGPATNSAQGEAMITSGAIPIQGRLTNTSGNPLSGTYSIMFRLYEVDTGGTAVCTDTRSVSVVSGLFSSYVEGCYDVITGQRLWLGVKVESDEEMTPRRLIMPAPYAISLMPGAVISDNTVYPVLAVESTHPSGRALRGYATATSGTNFGVVGASTSPNGYGGYFYNNENGIGLYGKGMPGVLGEGYGTFGGYGVLGRAGAFGAGVKGEGNLSSFGGWFTSTDFVALYVTSNREDDTDALELDGAKDGEVDFSVTNDGDVKQAWASNGLVKAGVNMQCGTTMGTGTRSFNNVGGAVVITETATGACTINFGFNVFDRYFVATSTSNAARFVSCYTSVSNKNELYCHNWDAAGVGQDGGIMVLVY